MKKLLFVPVAAAAVALSVSACGDSKDDAGGAAAPTASAPAAQAGGEASAAPSKGGQTSNGGGKLTPVQREMLTKLRNCMIKKGYGMPEVSAGNPVMAPSDKKGRSDEHVNKDAGQCLAENQPKMPSPPTGG